MDSARIVRAFEQDEGAISLMAGSPGPETLKDCKDILLKATCYMLDEDTDPTSTFRYGPDMGDLEFREQLANFLTQQYGDTVDRLEADSETLTSFPYIMTNFGQFMEIPFSHQLMATAGATQALHMIATLLFTSGAVVFMEDPTYFAAYNMLKHDLNMEVVSVPCDEEGMDTDVLERLLTEHSPKAEDKKGQLFWAMVYTIPVYNNPTGHCYSPRRCRRMVELARKHNVLLLAEDVYNLIHFGESYPPPRLLAYDKLSDPDFKGHTLSSGTFSKVLAPGLRLGWVEGPEHILRLLHGSFFAWSGGSPNHYASKLAAATMKLGLQTEHMERVRRIYKQRRDAVCRILRENLPQGATFTEPQGGFFVWIEFPKGTDTFEMVKWMVPQHHIFFLPGICTSMEGKCKHCARISFSFYPENVLVEAVSTLCKAAKEFIGQRAI